jgi:signal transduction histidine kinase
VIINLTKTGEDGPARIEVADSGTGIPETDLIRVFEPFFTTKPSGTGLGLAIARSIVQKHGGDIAIRNREGGGVIAVVELPMIQDEAPV